MNMLRKMGLKDKDLQLGDFAITKNYIADKLKQNWVIILGDAKTINTIENVVYTPGTEKNDDFALIMGKILPEDETITNLFLAKKTDLLRVKLAEWGGISEEVYDKLIMINIVDKGKENGVIWDYSVTTGNDSKDGKQEEKQKEYDDFAEYVVKDLLQMK